MSYGECAYENCTRRTFDTDSDGDEVCEMHLAQENRYTVVAIIGEFDGNWINEELIEPLQNDLAAHGWDVEIRRPRRGEAEGTYRHDRDGLQILGFSIPEPEPLKEAVRESWNRVVTGLTTDADLFTAIAAGELFLVEDSEAALVLPADVDALAARDGAGARGFGRGRYGYDWILVRAESAADAIAVSRVFDASESFGVALRRNDALVSVTWQVRS